MAPPTPPAPRPLDTAYFSTAAVAQVPRRCGEEIARVLTGQRPLNVMNTEIYAPGAVCRAR